MTRIETQNTPSLTLSLFSPSFASFGQRSFPMEFRNVRSVNIVHTASLGVKQKIPQLSQLTGNLVTPDSDPG